MKKSLTMGFLIAVVIAGVAQAQSIPTFDRVLASALANHPAILGKRSEQEAARAEKKGAEWARFPSPSIEASTLGTGRDDSLGLLRLDQPLWTGGRITAGIEGAGSRLDAAGAGLEETRLDMTLRVINAYIDALRQKAREQYAADSVKEHEKLLAMIHRRVEQNVSSNTDRRLAESRLLQVKNESFLTSQALQNALTRLQQLSGETVTDVSWQGVDETGAPASLETALRDALASSPTLERLRHEEAAAEADIDSRRSVYMPTVVFRLEHSTGGGTSDDSRGLVVLQAQPGAGLSAGSGVEAAIARREAIRRAREAAEREIRERIALDWNDWMAASLRLDAAESSSEISNEVFESYTRQYVIGRKTWIDVLNAVRETMNARFTLADARAQLVAASLRLQAQIRTWKTQ